MSPISSLSISPSDRDILSPSRYVSEHDNAFLNSRPIPLLTPQLSPNVSENLSFLKPLNSLITVDKDSAHMKAQLAVDFADLIYNGKWFTPVREALSAFADKTQEHVTGSVKLKLYKGNMITASITSPESLYSEELVTFNESSYDQTNATGFINLWGLPDTVLALREQGKL